MSKVVININMESEDGVKNFVKDALILDATTKIVTEVAAQMKNYDQNSMQYIKKMIKEIKTQITEDFPFK